MMKLEAKVKVEVMVRVATFGEERREGGVCFYLCKDNHWSWNSQDFI